MAERRMLAKTIIESDSFMDMPADAQMLYVRLNLASDDDGFCDNPRAIMRACGAGNDAMKILIAKKFVLTFPRNDGFVVVIKHWRINNYIRKDTYHESKYKELMRDLYYDENHSYSTNPGDGHVPCLPPGDRVTSPSRVRDESETEPRRKRDESLTQVSIGKERGRIEESRSGQDNKDTHSFKASIPEGGLGGDEPARLSDEAPFRPCGAPPPQGEADAPTVSSADSSPSGGGGAGGQDKKEPLILGPRSERIAYYRQRLDTWETYGLDPSCWIRAAEREGIAYDEIRMS